MSAISNKATGLFAIVVLACASAAHAVDMTWAPVGNPGNTADNNNTGYGAVDYVYNIGKYEVTAGQYTEFLNAVADTDTYGLYNESMRSASYACEIKQIGSSGTYTYIVASGLANRPVNYVSWGAAARFSNWMHNGQPTGVQDLTTTEDGSYFLNGAMGDEALLAVTRETDAIWVIPSEDEWYKAAYHKNDGVTGNYWDYPTQSDSAPTAEPPPGTIAGIGSANYDYVVGNLTDVGAYTFKPSVSPYNTFDQGGNAWEWNEAVVSGSFRGLRGGGFGSSEGAYMHASTRNHNVPTGEYDTVGFRVAMILRGDANGDGVVNILDLSLLSGNWQGTGKTWGQGDFTGDGIVNISDLSDLSGNWGYGEASAPVSFASSSGTDAVPEPGTLALLLLGGTLLMRRRR